VGPDKDGALAAPGLMAWPTLTMNKATSRRKKVLQRETR